MKKPRMFLKAHTSVIASAAKLSLFEKKIASLPAAPRNDPSHLVPGYVALSIAIVAYLLMPALALAHGGMGPEEIGPPIVTSGLLGFVGYWVVMLWPSVKKKMTQEPR